MCGCLPVPEPPALELFSLPDPPALPTPSALPLPVVVEGADDEEEEEALLVVLLLPLLLPLVVVPRPTALRSNSMATLRRLREGPKSGSLAPPGTRLKLNFLAPVRGALRNPAWCSYSAQCSHPLPPLLFLLLLLLLLLLLPATFSAGCVSLLSLLLF